MKHKEYQIIVWSLACSPHAHVFSQGSPVSSHIQKHTGKWIGYA